MVILVGFGKKPRLAHLAHFYDLMVTEANVCLFILFI